MRHWIPALILAVLPMVVVADADGEATSRDADHKTTGHDVGHDATVRHSFDDVEHWVEVFDDPERDAWQKPESLIGFLGIRRGDKVADIGAGTGYFTAKLSLKVGRDGRVYAVDIEKALLDHLMQRDDLSPYETVIPILAEPDDPKLPEGGIDLVLVVNTWHHIDDRLNYLGHIDRALGLGGRLVIVDYREGELPVGPPPGHKLSRDALVQELAKAGWSLTSESPMLPYQYVLVFHPPAGEQPATR